MTHLSENGSISSQKVSRFNFNDFSHQKSIFLLFSIDFHSILLFLICREKKNDVRGKFIASFKSIDFFIKNIKNKFTFFSIELFKTVKLNREMRMLLFFSSN
jgi:hypothetical protein